MRYLVEKLAVNGTQRIIPFRIALPHDCKAVVGFSAVTDAQVQTLVSDSMATTLFGTVAEALKMMVESIKQQGDIPVGLTYVADYPTGPVVFPTINLLKYKVGTVHLRRLSEIIAVEDVLPMRYRLGYIREGPSVITDDGPSVISEVQQLDLPLLTAPADRFQPIDVSGNYELAGWLEVTDAGLQVVPNLLSATDMGIEQDKFRPYTVTLTLAYSNG